MEPRKIRVVLSIVRVTFFSFKHKWIVYWTYVQIITFAPFNEGATTKPTSQVNTALALEIKRQDQSESVNIRSVGMPSGIGRMVKALSAWLSVKVRRYAPLNSSPPALLSEYPHTFHDAAGHFTFNKATHTLYKRGEIDYINVCDWVA